MARQARGEYLDPNEIQVVHAVQRCVRQAFLCGLDKNTGNDYEHRRQWIRDRFEFLASVFGIDCLTYTVLSNHLHIVLRSRPDVVKAWSDEEVARRWCRLFPKQRDKTGEPLEPTQAALNMILLIPAKLAEVRLRLSDISWWMRCTAENIARQANKEDATTGRFWQGRYHAQLLLDEGSILACAAYVDLNPIRAAMADRPEDSKFTGAKDRLDDLQQRQGTKRENLNKSTHQWERSRARGKSGWMAPIEIDERSDPIGCDQDSSGRRASKKGFLSLSMAKYLDLLDWTGRQIRAGSSGSIPKDLAPILTRIGLDSSSWFDVVSKFGKVFKRVAGSPQAMTDEAAKRNQSWMQAPGSSYFAT